ncbi:MAG TPA: NrfD/PsrC family molybdoenzyme membrane anchor subunit [Anaeromyxobacteraceae bacterium]|nr:NrfD/PsrC family molybdoenzyme membrane anchor subunit [Anaeromyxobacteraceae bacterium]
MNEIDVARYSTNIDPHLHVWGWEIPVYLFLGGMAAGTMILSALLSLRKGERSDASRWLAFAAPVLVSVGMGALFLDLAHKLYVWRFYLALRWTSPMSWGAWILVVAYPVTILFGLSNLTDAQLEWLLARVPGAAIVRLLRRARELGVAHARRLAWWNLGTGVALGVYTGILLSTLGARALWNSALLGPLFLVSGLSTGAAFLMLFRVTDDERHFLVRWDVLAIGLEITLIALFLVGLATSDAAGRHAAGLLLGGPYTAPFWTLVVIVGLLVPALLETLESRLHYRVTAVAPLLVLAGGFALRWIVVAAGQV